MNIVYPVSDTTKLKSTLILYFKIIFRMTMLFYELKLRGLVN